MTEAASDVALLARVLAPQSLHLIVMPTEACNFRCVYCYETYEAGRMRPETVRSVQRLLDRRAGDLSELYLGWFGGEPLLARDIVRAISEHAAHLAALHQGLSYRAGMSTNGYLLTGPVLDELAAVGVLDYQITLDGPPLLHDARRRMADGRGSFERIWANLLAIRESPHPVAITLRLHVDADTADQLDPLLEAVDRELLSDPRFSAFLKGVARLGGAGDAARHPLSDAEQQAVFARLRTKLRRELAADRPAAPNVCYAARPSSLVIRADGSVAKCTVALRDPRNHLGVLCEDGTLDLIDGAIAPWIRGIATLDPATLGCPLRGLPPSAEKGGT